MSRDVAGHADVNRRSFQLALFQECLPILSHRLGEQVQIIIFVLDPQVVGRIPTHVGKPTSSPQSRQICRHHSKNWVFSLLVQTINQWSPGLCGT